MFAFSLFAIAALQIGAAIPPAGLKVSPLGKWVVDYAESFCILSRQGSGDQPGVAFRTRPVSDQHDLLLLFPSDKGSTISGKGRLSAGKIIGTERWIASGQSKDMANWLVDTTLSSNDLDDIAAAGGFRITIPRKLEVAAQTPGMAKALTALHLCEEDLARRWQVARGWVVPAKPVGNLAALFTSRAYPSVSYSRGNQGGVRVLLSIDRSGAVSDCRIIQGSGYPQLDQVPCKVYRNHARFHPALDAQGKPIAGSFIPPRVYFTMRD